MDVWKRYRGEWVLKGVNLKIEENSLIAIVGKNGSGKTTLLKLMCGLIKPTKGVVRILGENVKIDRSYKGKIGVLLHENVLYEELTVRENMEFYERMFGGMSDLARDVFKRLGLEKFEGKKVKALSYGWKKRVNLVRALINDPKILLLDEPLSGLDEDARKEIIELMFELSKDKVIVFTTPSPLDIRCRILKLENGVLA